MNRTQITTAAAMLCAGCISASGQPSIPDVEPGDAEADARALVDAVLGGSVNDMLAAEHEEVAAWAQTVIDRALNLGPAGNSPLVPGDSMAPAEVRGFAGKGANTAEVLVFMSLAVPEPSWRQWSAQSARIGAPMVLRGVVEGGLAATVRAIQSRGPQDGAAIDPRLFRLFRIGSVPAVAVVPGGVPACSSPGCSADAVPPHDLVTGNIGLEGALEAIAREDGPGRAIARRHLAVLRGETE